MNIQSEYLDNVSGQLRDRKRYWDTVGDQHVLSSGSGVADYSNKRHHGPDRLHESNDAAGPHTEKNLASTLLPSNINDYQGLSERQSQPMITETQQKFESPPASILVEDCHDSYEVGHALRPINNHLATIRCYSSVSEASSPARVSSTPDTCDLDDNSILSRCDKNSSSGDPAIQMEGLGLGSDDVRTVSTYEVCSGMLRVKAKLKNKLTSRMRST